MNIGTLEVICDHIDNISPIWLGSTAIVKLILDDVDCSGLMRQMVEQLDPESLLDYFKDEVIEEYLTDRKGAVLSPREQYEALSDSFLSAEVVEVKL
tara:strand:+ start:42594 stop:42884 length:291 start_codon:yes stop_codon:yes gene_type:complete